MSDSLKYTTAQKITLKNCFYAPFALLGFTFVTMCILWIISSDSIVYNSTPFFHPFKIAEAFSIVLLLKGFGFGGIIDIYKSNNNIDKTFQYKIFNSIFDSSFCHSNVYIQQITNPPIRNFSTRDGIRLVVEYFECPGYIA